MKVACSGSFDPITRGHLDIIHRCHRLFGEVVVGVGQNTSKSHMFDPGERLELVRGAVSQLPAVHVEPITGLMVDFARLHGADAIVRGLRFAGDFDYELQMAHMNHRLSGMETVFLPGAGRFATLSSSMLREVARNGADISEFVTPEVERAIAAKLERAGE